MATGKFVSYLRVSTKRQGESGLGLEAQRKAVEDYLNGGHWSLVAEYVEIESGKRDDRPKLRAALHHAKVTGARLLIAKLDRLSRDAHFLLGLQKAGVQFTACDMRDANELTIGILALVAQNEREAISKRTKAALAAAKARGQKLGNPNGAAPLRRAGKGNRAAIGAIKERADQHAKDILPVIDDIRAAGITTLEGIAAELNARGILTARRGAWYPSTVKRLLARSGALPGLASWEIACRRKELRGVGRAVGFTDVHPNQA
jgi:DNA invertase Pin-like site-specific DNA recombinase